MKTKSSLTYVVALATCVGLSLARLMAHDNAPPLPESPEHPEHDHGQHNPGSPGYMQINLVSDGATNGNAPRVDPRLVNSWGIVAGPDSVWVNDNGPGLTTAYTPSGHTTDFSISIPGPGGASGTPSGLVFNKTKGFVISNGSKSAPSDFLMSTEDGFITAWNEKISGTNAVVVVSNSASGAVYKGLAIATDTNGNPALYAANFHAGFVDMFDSQFHFVSSFTDANVPTNFAPFNIRNIQGKLFVTFAVQKPPGAHDDLAGAGNGYVDVFDVDGTLLRRFASTGPLNSPWGMAVAPKEFGKFSGALLVGNFGDGKINAFDLLSGKFLGALQDAGGNDIVINGLWGLTFEREPVEGRECEFFAQRLYFAAGLNDEADGLLGYIRPVHPTFPAEH